MPKQIVTAIGLIVSLGVIALGVFLVALPVYFQAVGVDAQTATVANTNAIYQAQVDNLHEQEANIDQINANVADLRSQIPGAGQYDDVFEVIGRAAESSGASIGAVTAGEQVAYVPWTGTGAAGTAAPTTEPTPQPTEDTTDVTTGTTDIEAGVATDATATAGRQQVDFVISATAGDMAQATTFLDALREGPRLLGTITAATTQNGEGIVNIQITALGFVDAEG